MNPQPFIDKVLEVFGFELKNPDKVARAVFGMSTSKGFVEGVGEEAAPELILAKYDQLGGYITRDGYKVKNRLFYDDKAYRLRGQIVPVKPERITVIVKVNGEFMEHTEGEKETLELQLAKKQFEEKKNEVKRGRPKKVDEKVAQ